MKNGRHHTKKRRERKNTHNINLSKLIISLLFLFKIVFTNLMLKNKIRLLDNYFSEIHLVIQGTGSSSQKFISNTYIDLTPQKLLLMEKDKLLVKILINVI